MYKFVNTDIDVHILQSKHNTWQSTRSFAYTVSTLGV